MHDYASLSLVMFVIYLILMTAMPLHATIDMSNEELNHAFSYLTKSMPSLTQTLEELQQIQDSFALTTLSQTCQSLWSSLYKSILVSELLVPFMPENTLRLLIKTCPKALLQSQNMDQKRTQALHEELFNIASIKRVSAFSDNCVPNACTLARLTNKVYANYKNLSIISKLSDACGMTIHLGNALFLVEPNPENESFLNALMQKQIQIPSPRWAHRKALEHLLTSIEHMLTKLFMFNTLFRPSNGNILYASDLYWQQQKKQCALAPQKTYDELQTLLCKSDILIASTRPSEFFWRKPDQSIGVVLNDQLQKKSCLSTSAPVFSFTDLQAFLQQHLSQKDIPSHYEALLLQECRGARLKESHLRTGRMVLWPVDFYHLHTNSNHTEAFLFYSNQSIIALSATTNDPDSDPS